MICPPEATWAVYADGELAGEPLRRAEAHLISCADCRARVLALREEARLLAAVLHERAPAVRAVRAGERSRPGPRPRLSPRSRRGTHAW